MGRHRHAAGNGAAVSKSNPQSGKSGSSRSASARCTYRSPTLKCHEIAPGAPADRCARGGAAQEAMTAHCRERSFRASREERPNADLPRHQPHQTPGEGFLERLAVRVLLLWGAQRHYPTRMIDIPPARAAAGGGRRAERPAGRGLLTACCKTEWKGHHGRARTAHALSLMGAPRESNPWPLAPSAAKASALPAELRARIAFP